MEKVGKPSVKGVGSAMVDYGIGAGGGLIVAVSQAITGSGFLGTLVSAGLAGSMLKGNRGSTIATIMGFQALTTMMTGGGDAVEESASGDEDVM